MSAASSSFKALVKRAAASQAGIIDGVNPAAFDSTDPIKLWVIQVGIILIVTQLLALICSRIRQPRVIAEVIGGVILGPSILGHIPGFSNNIFPKASLPYLNLTATIALVLFLFLVGLEIDLSAMGKQLKKAGLISAAGMLLPFGIGAAVSVPIYNNFVDHDKVSFGHFLLFTCVALSITAFPVLCRILTELKLLETTVGVTVLAAGVGNDVVGWILLALTVALVNAGSGVTAVYVLLAGVGWTLFLLFPVRKVYYIIARSTGSLETGVPTPFLMMLTFLLVFTSAFFTDIIGIHPIFGGFLAGLIIPHEGGFAIALTEKIEDLVTILLLPVYFVLSGLKTDMSTLDTGKAWGYTFLLITAAFFGKFIGCFATARLTKFNLREAGAIGALMSCKGLVELIVLNVGLSAGILDTRLFSMFVFMAIILTLITTPLTIWIYPAHIRKIDPELLATSSAGGEDEKASGVAEVSSLHKRDLSSLDPEVTKSRYTVILERIEHLPATMTMVQLLQASSSASKRAPRVDALRLIELSDRTSAVMRGSDPEDLLRRDSIVKVFETFARLNKMTVTSSLSVAPQESFASSVVGHATGHKSELIVLPFNVAVNAAPSAAAVSDGIATTSSFNPFSGLFATGASAPVATETSVVYSQFLRQVFAQSAADVALVIDRGEATSDGQHIFLPFFGGPDDRLALTLLLQLVSNNPSVTATVLRVQKSEDDGLSTPPTRDTIAEQKSMAHQNFTVTSIGAGFPDTIYAQPTTETRLTSQTADSILWSRVTGTESDLLSPSNASRVKFESIVSPQPLHAVIEYTRSSSSLASRKNVIVATGRARRLAVESHQGELRELVVKTKAQSSGELRKTMGDVASAFVIATSNPILVFQASTATNGQLDA